MHDTRMRVLPAGLLALVLALGGCQRQGTTDGGSADVELDGQAFHVSGPYSHENLTVFLIHSDRRDDRDFLTLPEGLRAGQVKITEKEEEQVGELRIKNESDRPLYLQEGERLQGGKQDRTIIASLVIPPQSGWKTVPTMCIEQSRWEEGATGSKFGFTVSTALAPKGVRGAGKIEGNQGNVWACVGGQKRTAQSRFKAPNSNSSANEMLDSSEVRSISDRFASALSGALSDHPDAVGVAIVVNGQVEEINFYPNHALFTKLYPRLLQSYALQAAMLQDLAKATEPVSPADIAEFMRQGREKGRQEREVGAGNQLIIRELDDNRFGCTTRYDGKLVHWQILKKNRVGNGGATAADVLGSDW